MAVYSQTQIKRDNYTYTPTQLKQCVFVIALFCALPYSALIGPLPEL